MEHDPTEDELVNAMEQKAKELAHRPPQEQEAWLDLIRKLAGDNAETERAIEAARRYMASCRAADEAERKARATGLRMTHAAEQAETPWIAMLEQLLSGSRGLSPDRDRRLCFLVHLLAAGHMYQGLHERLTQPDAFKYLLAVLHDHPLEPEPE